MEMNMTPERQAYIEKLDRQMQAIDSIFKMDSGTVVSSEQKKQLRELREDAETAYRKLKNNEFEIAIVGMEKAGKSTFANALMENNLLPTKDLRCTFTSTRIEYSGDNKEDSATVSFYTADEFNRDFKDKLCKLGFPNYEGYSFDTLMEEVYQRHYENDVSAEKKLIYGDSIHEDILAIIKNADSLRRLLGQPSIAFAANQVDSGELAAYITDESKARAVKEVVIRSKKLSEMKNAIIFDVPGFNSPTELHKKQTLERMKSADAIIVVANGISPSLTDESLKILRHSDNEGNPLSDKLFVFANKIDGADDIRQNIKDTRNEWITNKKFVSKENRIIFGSALAHLQAAGLGKDERVLKIFKEREGDLPDGDGIDAMRKELAAYNKTERFAVLKRRVDKIQVQINKVFESVRDNQMDYETARSYNENQVEIIHNFIRAASQDAEKSLKDLRDKIRKKVPEEKHLSQQIRDYINSSITTEHWGIIEKDTDEAARDSQFADTHEDITRIEPTLREKRFNEMYDDFSRNVVGIADGRHHEYSKQILDIIMDAMGISQASPYRDELREALKKEITPYRGDMSEGYYQSLIERFSRDIYQILILEPYGENRLNEFYANIDNFYSLSIFYKEPDCKENLAYINIAPKDQPLCMMLLFHYYINTKSTLQTLSKNICGMMGLGELPAEIVDYLTKAFSASWGNSDILTDAVKKAVSKAADFVVRSEDFKVNVLKQIFAQIVEQNEPSNVSDRKAFTEYYKKYHASLRKGELYSTEFFRADFDDDIRILHDVLENAFVNAINMEKPFVAREVKSIGDILKYIKNGTFESFITHNYTKIQYDETQIWDKENREKAQNAAIVNEINKILDRMENDD